MNQEIVLEVFSQAMLVALKLAGPMLLVSVMIGLIVAIFQAATQIHEQTLTFVPKLLLISTILLTTSGWMIATMSDFVYWVYSLIPMI